MNTKICKDCKEEKILEECFYSSFNPKYNKHYYAPYCKICANTYYKDKKREYSKAYNRKKTQRIKDDPEFAEYTRAQKRKNSKKNHKAVMLSNAKQRARRFSMEFNLTLEDIIIPEICPILKVPFIEGTRQGFRQTPTLDRIDSSKGYIKGNVKVISMLANSMKTDATLEQCLTFAQNIESYFKGN